MTPTLCVVSGTGRRYLKNGAVPSIFPFKEQPSGSAARQAERGQTRKHDEEERTKMEVKLVSHHLPQVRAHIHSPFPSSVPNTCGENMVLPPSGIQKMTNQRLHRKL